MRGVESGCRTDCPATHSTDVVVGEDNNGASAQVLGHLLEVAEQGHGLMLRAAIALAEEHEARQRQTLLCEKFAEVGVS